MRKLLLVRKKLKWSSKPFEVPKDILNAWRKIGEKGMQLEKDWQQKLNKKNSKIVSELKNNYIQSNFEELENIIKEEKIKYFESKPSMATRQCSSEAIESISNVLPQLIGGSADLSGSNNTKTKNSKVISSRNFNGNYIHYGVREHGMANVL